MHSENIENTRKKNQMPKIDTKIIKTSNGDFEVPTYYQYIKTLGSGAYGTVIAARNEKTLELVAIKKVHHVFTQDREYQKRILREVKILRHFSLYPHENIVMLLDLIPPKSFESFNDVYIVMELLDIDLRAMLKTKQCFSLDNVRIIMYQLLQAVKYIHSAHVLHRDIKPSNILLKFDDSNTVMKMCDFGLSRSVNFDDPKQSTTYVATRWYRAPELLLMWDKSSKGIDLWSLGCIFAELLRPSTSRTPLFPGQSYLHQLELVMDICGKPDEVDVKGCEKAKQYLKTVPSKQKKNFSEIFPNTNAEAIDLLEKLLTFDPSLRITTEQALEHPFFLDIDCEEDKEIKCPVPFDYDVPDDMKTKKIKEIMYEEFLDYHLSKLNKNTPGSASLN